MTCNKDDKATLALRFVVPFLAVLLLVTTGASFDNTAYAETEEQSGAVARQRLAEQPTEREALGRVGGTYRVDKIEKISDGDFRITFSNESGSKHRRLVLVSDHVHIGVKSGQWLRLSAEILREHKGITEVAQVLLFLPTQQGTTPVWMLSKHSSTDLRGARFLEMHAPSSDYIMF